MRNRHAEDDRRGAKDFDTGDEHTASRTPSVSRPTHRPRAVRHILAVCALVAYVSFCVSFSSISTADDSDGIPRLTAESILANQPRDIVDRLFEENVVVMQEIRGEGDLRGGLISAYVLFNKPPSRVFSLLSQSTRQTEFRPELTSIETVEMGALGPVDEHRLKILFRRYAFRIKYTINPESHHIEWVVDERFDNDLAFVSGSWDLYPLPDGRTLGRCGTRIDVGPSIPAFLQDWITRKNLPKTMERVRLWVESEGAYRP